MLTPDVVFCRSLIHCLGGVSGLELVGLTAEALPGLGYESCYAYLDLQNGLIGTCFSCTYALSDLASSTRDREGDCLC